MNSILDILRGPALGVVIMIFALAGVIVITAFAALIAQVSLLLRLRPWQTQPAVKPQAVPEVTHFLLDLPCPEAFGSRTGRGGGNRRGMVVRDIAVNMQARHLLRKAGGVS